MPSENTGGSQTTSGTTEHTLATITTPGTYQAVLDVSALAWGATSDALRVRVYTVPRSGGTERLERAWTIGPGAQTETCFRTPPILVPFSVRYTIQMVQGADRAIPWSVHAV